jgi:UTP--glucose-1-phosphate uridylyltransferase
VVLKLNGGLGTSMGMTQAKSLVPVKNGLTFLDLIARQVLHLRHEYGCRLPLVLMNSFRTREDSLAHLKRYEELASDVPADFLQHKVPKVDADDLTPARWPAEPSHEWCPPGHGDIYTALVTSGTLPVLLEAGYRWAFVSNSDNLGAVPDPAILGWVADEKIPFLMEVCTRSEAHKKGGYLARRKSGGLALRELAQCPDDELDDFQDVKRHRFFNTNNLWLDLRVLDDVLRRRGGVLGLPMIRNEKTVDPTDPSSPRVYQIETAMGAAIEVFEGARALCVPRARFAPVKTTNDLLALWSDAFILADDARVVSARPPDAPALLVDLDPTFYKRIDQLEARFPEGAPSLLRCNRFTVRGDVRFGSEVVVEGDVEVTAGEGIRTIPSGIRLSGDATS